MAFNPILPWTWGEVGGPFHQPTSANQVPGDFVNTTNTLLGTDVSNVNATTTRPSSETVIAQSNIDGEAGITQGDFDAAFALLGSLQGMPGVTQEDIDFLARNIQSAVSVGDRNALTAAVEAIQRATTNAENLGQFEEQRAEAQRLIGENVNQLETLGTDTNNLFNERISRLSGFLNTPGTIRSDPELAAALGEVENAIDTQVGRQRTTAAKNLSDSGLRASGKITDRVGNAELLGTAQKGLNFSSLLNNIQSRRDTLESDQNQFNLGLTDSLNAARSGAIPQLTNLTQLGASANQPLDLSSSGLTALDTNLLGQGIQQQDFGNLMQVLSLGAGIANNSVAGFNSIFGQGGALGRSA